MCRQPMPYFFTLQNGEQFVFAGISARLFSSLSYVEKMPDAAEYELLPGENYTFRTKLVCKYRGEYEVGIKEIVITDFFRIFQLRYRLPSTIKALVYPRMLQLEELRTLSDINTYLCRENPRIRTEADVTVRDYAQGDSLKYIHWKATAREQKLKTRNRVGEEQQGICLFFDTGRYSKKLLEYLPLENLILELVLALGYFYAQKNVTYTAFYSQKGLRQSRVEGIRSYETFYQEMAQVIFEEEEAGSEVFAVLTAQGALAESKVVIAVLHEIEDGMIQLAGQLAAGGQLVVLYVVTDQNIESYVRQSSSRLRIMAVPTDTELEAWL